MRSLPITATLLALTVALTGITPVHAQILPIDTAATTTVSEPPNPFPIAPLATTTSPTDTPPQEEVATPEPTTVATTTDTKPTPPKKKVTPASVVKKKTPTPTTATTTEPAATSTPTTTPPALPPILSTQENTGDIYSFTRHAPLSAENTQVLLGLAALCALAGFLLAQKRFLENTFLGVTALFSTRSLPQPQAERQ